MTPLNSLGSRFLRGVVGAILLIGLASSLAAADPTGVWKFEAAAEDGRTVASTLTLKLEQGALTGAIENRAGRAEISHASLDGDQIRFSVVREFGRLLRKKKFETRYTATLRENTLEGTIELKDRQGESRMIPFTARRQ